MGSSCSGGKPWLAHRVAYVLTHGDIPDGSGYHGAVVRHKCDNPKCCNPAHLQLGTQKDNVQDMYERGRAVNNSPSGEAHGNAILNNAQREAIKADPRGHSEVARQYGVSPQVVFYIRNKWNQAAAYKDGRSETSKGATNPNSRLTEQDIRSIRASVEKPGAVAKQFGITPDYVTLIRKRKVWKHIA